MKIITVNVNKGGAGKTTLAYNLAEYLQQRARVLLLDFDDSANLTNRYGDFERTDQTVVGLFDHGIVEPVKITDCLDLIAGHKAVELLKERLSTRRRREEIFGRWLAMNEAELEAKYDYIVIDTENDEGLLTINALIVSDFVIGVAEPSKDSFLALLNLRRFITVLNDEFNWHAKLLLVANKINLSENASLELLQDLSEDNDYIGYLPQRTLLKENQSIFMMAAHGKTIGVLHQVTTLFDQLVARFNMEAQNGTI
jgi:chromosome partitioning protein